jgi:orotidine-5'-phosphate decarboxylase
MFSTKLNQKILEKNSRACIGLDPRLEWLPKNIISAAIKNHGKTFAAASEAITTFNKQVIDTVAKYVAVVKLQMAFYEQYGPDGLRAFWDTVNYAKDHDLLVISDAKRGDIDATAQAYANSLLGTTNLFETETKVYDVDCVTINPFLGEDSLIPFIETCHVQGKGIFILAKTSNPGSNDLQNLVVNGQTISTIVASMIAKHANQHLGNDGYSSIGAVVGATFPEEARQLRKQLPHSIFLVPGIGAQGGDTSSLSNFFNDDGLGAIVNSSRGVTFSKKGNEGTEYLKLIEMETKNLVSTINTQINS